MTMKEIKTTIETMKAEIIEKQYRCKQSEREILNASYTKKADLEMQLATYQEVVNRNRARLEREKAEAEKAEAPKKVASLKKPATKKAEAEKKAPAPKKTVKKAEPKKVELFPASYETDKSVLTKAEFDADKLTSGDLLIGRYYDIKTLTDLTPYSLKETDINDRMWACKKAKTTPFYNNIDLYKVVAENAELYIIQSIITESFTSIRKDAVEAVENIGLYTITPKKAEPKKKAPTKKANKQ